MKMRLGIVTLMINLKEQNEKINMYVNMHVGLRYSAYKLIARCRENYYGTTSKQKES